MEPMTDYLRRVILRPYRKGMGPSFTLTLTHYEPRNERDYVFYRFTMRENGRTTVLFDEDWIGMPLIGSYTVDGDYAVRAAMDAITLRPGDTDEEYFVSYTPEQLQFADQHAESLTMEVAHRFGED